jgi:hypothetical protein
MVVAEDRDDVKPYREAGVGRRHNVILISTVASGKSVYPPGWHVRRCPACSQARADGHTRRRRREAGAERRRWPRVTRFGDGWLPRHSVLAPPDIAAVRSTLEQRTWRPVGVMVFGVPADPKIIAQYEALGVDEVVVPARRRAGEHHAPSARPAR